MAWFVNEFCYLRYMYNYVSEIIWIDQSRDLLFRKKYTCNIDKFVIFIK